MAGRAGGADIVVFGSDYRTPPATSLPSARPRLLLDGGPAAVAIAPANFRAQREARDPAHRRALRRRRRLRAEHGHRLGRPPRGELTTAEPPCDLLVVGSRPEAPGRPRDDHRASAERDRERHASLCSWWPAASPWASKSRTSPLSLPRSPVALARSGANPPLAGATQRAGPWISWLRVRTLVVSDFHLGAGRRHAVLEWARAARAAARRARGDRPPRAARGHPRAARELAPPRSLPIAEPVLRDIGERIGARGEVVIVPGNHDQLLIATLAGRPSRAARRRHARSRSTRRPRSDACTAGSGPRRSASTIRGSGSPTASGQLTATTWTATCCPTPPTGCARACSDGCPATAPGPMTTRVALGEPPRGPCTGLVARTRGEALEIARARHHAGGPPAPAHARAWPRSPRQCSAFRCAGPAFPRWLGCPPAGRRRRLRHLRPRPPAAGRCPAMSPRIGRARRHDAVSSTPAPGCTSRCCCMVRAAAPLLARRRRRAAGRAPARAIGLLDELAVSRDAPRPPRRRARRRPGR